MPSLAVNRLTGAYHYAAEIAFNEDLEFAE